MPFDPGRDSGTGLPYSENSIAGRLLRDDAEAVGLVVRWVSAALTWPRFWMLRREWPDLVQEVLARVLESLRDGRYDDRRDFGLYVQGIARFTALRTLRQSSRRLQDDTTSVETLAGGAGGLPGDRLAGRELLRRVLDLSSEECRFLIRAYSLEELSYADIATALALPFVTVQSRLCRCVEGTRRALHVVHRGRDGDAGS